MSTLSQLHARRSEIMNVASRHGVTTIRIFGSVARGDDLEASDIDLLVTTGPRVSAWFPAGLANDLESLLGRSVDIVTERGLHPLLRTRVLAEARPL